MFEIWFTDDQDVHMRLQTLKVSLKKLISYLYESRSCMWRRSWDIRYDNQEGSLEFDLSLLQLWSKIALNPSPLSIHCLFI